MLQPTQITLFVLLWFIMLVGGAATGVVCGAHAFGVAGGIIGGAIGLALGHVVGKLPEVLSTRWLFRSIARSSDEELWKTVNLGFWNFTQTLALLQLAGRNKDVQTQLPRIIEMLGADDELTRVYGWDALRLVFTNEAAAIRDYTPRAPAKECRLKVVELRQTMEKMCQPSVASNGGPTTRPGDSRATERPPPAS